MDHVDYVYTSGMDESDLDTRLREETSAVVALADGDEAYAVPLSYHYDGDRLLLRISTHDDNAEKRRFLETTETATFVLYADDPGSSWSIHVRGPIRKWDDDPDETTLNQWFPPFRLFDEAVGDVSFSLYELEMDTVIGREQV
jgi:nitroimidazol reductase NimA-like FMN-containing flavoprotein (pyridoxamine 5'-phosphate oxidase superfamily)